MALQVWLPLNGDLKNKGCADVTVTNNGATVDNNGKIGKCYKFNGSSNYITINKQLLNSVKFSVCAWCKFNNNVQNHTIVTCRSNIGYGIALFALSSGRFRFDTNDVNGQFTIGTWTANKWFHIAITYDGYVKRVYVDGQQIGYTNSTLSSIQYLNNGWCIGASQSDSSIGGQSNFTNGSLNDVRIYDHCLSPKEVKEISQGLILHYKLDNYIGKNLVNNCKNITTGWGKYAAVDSLTYENGRVKAVGASSGSPRIYNSTILPYASTQEYYTIYIDYECDSNISVSGKSSSSTTSLNENGAQSIGTVTRIKRIDLGNNRKIDVYSWYRLAATDTIKSSWWMIGFGANATLYINSIKVEKGLNENIFWTPYNIEYPVIDSSGHNNNGTIIGNLTISDDTPRYNNCLNFNSGSIDIPFCPDLNNDFTINLWINIDNIEKNNWFVNGGNVNNNKSFNFGLNASAKLQSLIFTHPGYYGIQVGNAETGWHMYTMIHKNGQVSQYIDGILHLSGNISINTSYVVSDITESIIKIRNGYNRSDIRIYATALSADDILQLYQVGASIDNMGNVHSYEIDELSDGRELMILPLTTPYPNKTNPYKFNPTDGIPFSGAGFSCGTDYIEINPSGKKYIYDFTISVAAGNQFYIGFERYDKDKTTRSNNACIYPFAQKPASDIVRRRYKGTVDLSTDGVNPCKYIRLRVLNAWTGTASDSAKTATIHQISLREVSTSTTAKTKLHKTGIFETDLLREGNDKAIIEKDVDMNINEFIET